MKWVPKIKPESGMTLIELLIAIAVSGIVLAGITQILTASTSSYSLQEEMAVMQQNIRMAKMFMERDSRMAGCGMLCGGIPGNRVYPVEFTNAADASNTDILIINYIDPDSSNCKNILPPLTLHDKMPPTSSEATVNEPLDSTSSPPTPPYSTWGDAAGFSCNSHNYGGTPFEAFKAIITSPDGKSDIVYITSVQSNSDKLQNAPYAGFDNKVLNTYPAGSTISFFDDDMLLKITYSYSNGTLQRKVNDNPSEAIADNIEDLQFAFGLDTDEDDEVDTWINNRGLTNTEKDQIRLIRINVLGRTSRQHYGQSNTRPAIEDHAAAAGPDKFGRQLFQTTVMPRNLKNNKCT